MTIRHRIFMPHTQGHTAFVRIAGGMVHAGTLPPKGRWQAGKLVLRAA